MTGTPNNTIWSRIRKLLGNGEHTDGETAPLLDQDVFGMAMRRERSRADRAGAPFSLVTVTGLRDKTSGNGSARRARLVANLGELLDQMIRCTDIAGWFDTDTVGLILPHTAGKDAWNLVERMQAELERRLKKAVGGNGIAFRVHTYPFEEEAPGTRYRQMPLFERRRKSRAE
jgi:hypothetical protein